ncbi:MAG TPA: hypothetical protein ENG44_03330 [Desulfurococcaceae archaeon]|nr:hypothetical protein [Desulfurococcaceae archaeon]
MPEPVSDIIGAVANIVNNLTSLLLIIGAVIILSIVAVAYATVAREGSRTSRERIRELPVVEEEEAAPTRRRTSTTELGDREISLLQTLRDMEALPLDTLKETSGESPSVIAERLAKLRDQGLIEVSGGIVTLTRRGKRIMELMLEKYWYREVEKRRR